MFQISFEELQWNFVYTTSLPENLDRGNAVYKILNWFKENNNFLLYTISSELGVEYINFHSVLYDDIIGGGTCNGEPFENRINEYPPLKIDHFWDTEDLT